MSDYRFVMGLILAVFVVTVRRAEDPDSRRAISRRNRPILALVQTCGSCCCFCFIAVRRRSQAETRWKEIADLYAMLDRIAPSPLHTLNRAVALAEWQGPEAGLALLKALAPPAWLSGSYLWDTVLGDLHRRAGNLDIAQRRAIKRALRGRSPGLA